HWKHSRCKSVVSYRCGVRNRGGGGRPSFYAPHGGGTSGGRVRDFGSLAAGTRAGCSANRNRQTWIDDHEATCAGIAFASSSIGIRLDERTILARNLQESRT